MMSVPRGGGSLRKVLVYMGAGWRITGKHTCSDAKACVEIIDDGKDDCVQVRRVHVSRSKANQWDENYECDVEPVNVLMPIRYGHWLVGDVNAPRHSHLFFTPHSCTV